MSGELMKEIGISMLAVAVAVWAGTIDWRFRRIPNSLTVPTVIIALTLRGWLWGWPGVKAGLEGAAIGFGALLPFVIARGIGAGDCKLMTALGALLGPHKTILVLLGTIFIAGGMAIFQMIRHKHARQTLANLVILVHAFATFRMNPFKHINLDNPALTKLPFGVAAASAMVLFFCVESAIKVF